MLEVLQNSGVGPKAANNPHATSAQAVASHRYRGRAGIGDKMLKLARKAGSRDCLRRQQREDGEKNDATPRKEAQQFYDEVGAGQDAVIAGILNRQDRKTAYGHRFTANHVSSLRRQWNIPRFEPPATLPEGELLTVKQAAAVLGIATSTVHRWLNDGSIGGEQLTPAAPWRIRLTEDLRAGFVNEAPQQGYLTMYQAMRLLGVSRQTVLQRVKRGELDAIHVMLSLIHI